jgi:hypothetical protein
VGSFDLVLVLLLAVCSAGEHSDFALQMRIWYFGWTVSNKVDASGISIVVAAAAAHLQQYW